MRPALCASLLAGLLFAALFDAVPAFAGAPDEPEFSETERAHHARRLLHNARAFLRQDRVDAAERALRRGLAVSPDDFADVFRPKWTAPSKGVLDLREDRLYFTPDDGSPGEYVDLGTMRPSGSYTIRVEIERG